ncbi:MAG: porphobilinogen synthase [bacterium]|nr:porphobilinogen synthase [bacterium]MCS7308589.1 porphobilinogen synthase [Armatimonadota bacterium]
MLTRRYSVDPTERLRRLRRTKTLRRMVQESSLSTNDFIYPVFVQEGRGRRDPIGAMPGQYRLSVDQLSAEVEQLSTLGVPAVLLFGIAAYKDARASYATQRDGVVPQAIRAIKAVNPDLVVMTDVCVCAYTQHGHCGILREDGYVDNDASLEVLAEMALAHAEAGADVVAPSAMMDGQVAAIRERLDEEGFTETAIMAYSAKYASAFYGPFREAADSAPQFGDRRSYQMDPPNAREAVREVLADVQQGADIVMVKPGLAYLDVVRLVREAVDLPLAVYNVSGEYSMLKAAAERGWIDERAVGLEMLTAFRRAGADLIITYLAKEAAEWLKDS